MEIIGHQHIINYFEKALSKDLLSHAYLFSGPEHVGKSTVARWLVEKLLDVKSADFWEKPNPDLYIVKLLEDKKEISINQIRDLRASMYQKPLIHTHKIVLIENIEQMSIAAVNALLKTLEEPPGDSLIILTTSKLERIPKTIISRCQQVKFKRVANDELVNELKDRKIKDAELLATLSAGRPGLALSWANDDESLKQVTEAATNFIGLISGDITQRLQFVEALLPKGLTLLEQANLALSNIVSWQTTLRDILLLRSGISDKITNIQAINELQKIAQQCSSQQLLDWHKKMDLTKEYLKQNVNPRLVLENLLLKIDYNA